MNKVLIKRSIVAFCLALLGLARRQSQQRSPRNAKPVGTQSRTRSRKVLGLSIYLQGGYTYNKDAGTVGGQTEENDLRVFDHKANSFSLDLAQIIFQKDAAPGNVGFKLKLSAGETAKWIHSRGLSGAPLTSAQAGEGTDSIDLTEAFISYNAASARGIKFDFGKFVTMHGAEVIEAKDDVNYSRSFLFNYAIPFTHTGLRISYSFLDSLSTGPVYRERLGQQHGQQQGQDLRCQRHLCAGGSLYPHRERHDRARSRTRPRSRRTAPSAATGGALLDVVATIKPVKNLSFIVNTDNGREQNIAAAGGPATWKGIAGIVKYDISETYSISVRGETFNDAAGLQDGHGPAAEGSDGHARDQAGRRIDPAA